MTRAPRRRRRAEGTRVREYGVGGSVGAPVCMAGRSLRSLCECFEKEEGGFVGSRNGEGSL